jgi:ABC-type transporter Mla subunit MlaD
MTIKLPTLGANTNGVETNPPKPNFSGDTPQAGGPTNPSLARGQIANTSIAFSNSNISHVCDISGNIKYTIAYISLGIKQAIEAIRLAVQSLFEGASGSPFTDGVRAVLTAIRAKVKLIQKLIDKAKEVQSDITGYISQLQQLISYVQSLPARIAEALVQCISDALSSISGAISNAQAIVNSAKSGGSLDTAVNTATGASSKLVATQNATTGTSQGPSIQLG